jgi:serine/threonine-protein kinase
VKSCKECGRLYPTDAGFCPVDGHELVNVSQAPVAGTDADPRVGSLVCDRYDVRRVVADGGMGRVYEALDIELKRSVALKILHADVAKDPVAVERFRREFDVSKLLSHEHVVEVFDFQPTPDGTFALAMEFLYGEELRGALKRETALAPARVVRMLAQLALGLDAAHEKKLVHRDLKPDNIFLCQTRDGDIIKILDFGSVKDKADNAKKLTVIGTTIGSPFYMAPEQAQGLETLDHRADVWALAAIAYECITGHVPFSGINGPSILLEILTKTPVPPSQREPLPKYPVPPTLDRVMAHAFQKNPAMRIGSVGELATQVGQAYGLDGSHRDWIGLTEAQVDATIQARLPELLSAKPTPLASDVLDDFFGAGGNVLGGELRVHQGADVAQTLPSEVAVIPAAMPRWVVPAVVIGVMLLVIVALVLLFVL